MTITLAHRVQSWFTSRMPIPSTTQSKTEAKAERMIAEGRFEAIRVGAANAFWVGTCHGDHGDYEVFAISQDFMDRFNIKGGRIACNCRYGNRPVNNKPCSHALGAEMLRLAGE